MPSADALVLPVHGSIAPKPRPAAAANCLTVPPPVSSQLVLGDRPIEITLQRAWDALSWQRRSELAAALAAGAVSVQQQQLDVAAIERLKEDDAVSLLFTQLSEEYPEVRCNVCKGCKGLSCC